MSKSRISKEDRRALVLDWFHPWIPGHQHVYRIHTSYVDTEGTLVAGMDLADAMEALAEAFDMDDSSFFRDCVTDTMADNPGMSESDAWERTMCDDGGWVFLNGAVPVSTADWIVRDASARDKRLVRLTYAVSARQEEGRRSRMTPAWFVEE